MKAAATIRPMLLWPLLLVYFLAGCAATPPAPSATAPDVQAKQARAAAAEGDYATAAQRFLDSAALSKDASRSEYLLSAAEAFQHAGSAEQARQTLQQLPGEVLDAGQYARRQLVAASLDMSEHNPRAAVDSLRPALRQGVPPSQAAAVHELRAVAYRQLGNYLEAARERVALAPLLTDPAAVHGNEQALWQSLMSLSGTALEALRTAPPPDTLSGWLELAAIAKSALTQPEAVAGRIKDWRARYPQHPVSPELLASLQPPPAEPLRRPGHIAVLLPLSGAIAPSAEAIRDGFLAAYEQRPDHHDYQPEIRFYDSTGIADIAQLYTQAIRDGAEFVVGPLEKDAIAKLRSSNAITAPTLALNYADSNDPAPDQLFQFGLAPEDEARMAAERAWLEGHQRALTIAPDGDWGKRTLRAFTDYWQQLGGAVVASQSYGAGAGGFLTPLRRLLNIDASEARARELRALLQTDIKFEPHRRHDADFIFMLALPREARQIPPQLKFLYAGDLPIYATSHVFDGRVDAARDRDLDGVTFTDIPWLLTPQQFPLREQTRQLWPDTADTYARLYALGVDAYRLIPYLDKLRTSPYDEFPGATGRLVIDHNNRIRRILLWARFSGGTPRLQPLAAAAPQDGPAASPVP
jgi:outer membrane PBP1 activator LpoA protein